MGVLKCIFIWTLFTDSSHIPVIYCNNPNEKIKTPTYFSIIFLRLKSWPIFPLKILTYFTLKFWPIFTKKFWPIFSLFCAISSMTFSRSCLSPLFSCVSRVLFSFMRRIVSWRAFSLAPLSFTGACLLWSVENKTRLLSCYMIYYNNIFVNIFEYKLYIRHRSLSIHCMK